MVRRATISRLPADILETLKAKLRGSGFSGYEVHAEWLTSLGYDISKSSVHRYGQQLATEDVPPASPERLAIMQLRMRCLELSALTDPDADDITEKADDFLEWIGLI